jgi:phage terminase Nu1 subunit (DNA packaging protein)
MAKQRTRTSSVTEIADFAGVARSTVYDWQKLPGWPGAPDGSVALWDVAAWHSTRLASLEEESIVPVSPADSPGLERFRLAKAGIAELDLQQRAGELVERERMHAFALRIASLFRKWLDRLQRQMGEDFFRTGIDVLSDIKAETDREFGEEIETTDATADAV